MVKIALVHRFCQVFKHLSKRVLKMENYCHFGSVAGGHGLCADFAASFPLLLRIPLYARLRRYDLCILDCFYIWIGWVIEFQFYVAWISFEFRDIQSRLLEQLPFIQDFEHFANVFYVCYFFLTRFWTWSLNFLHFLFFKQFGSFNNHLVWSLFIFDRVVIGGAILTFLSYVVRFPFFLNESVVIGIFVIILFQKWFLDDFMQTLWLKRNVLHYFLSIR